MVTVTGSSRAAELVAAVISARIAEPVHLASGETADSVSRTVTGIGAVASNAQLIISDSSVDIPEAEFYVMMPAARDLLADIERLAYQLRGSLVLIVGGGVAAAAAAHEVIVHTAGYHPRTIIGELQSFPFLGEISKSEVAITGVKERMPVGAVVESQTSEIVEAVERWLPDVRPRPYLDVTTADVNPVIHPTICLANVSQLEAGEDVSFFGRALSPAVGRLIEAMDSERLAVLRAASIGAKSALQTLLDFYRSQGMRGDSLYFALSTFEPYHGAALPKTLDHRYLVDDVFFGLRPVIALARELQVSTPLLEATVKACTELVGRSLGDDLRSRALVALAGGFSATPSNG